MNIKSRDIFLVASILIPSTVNLLVPLYDKEIPSIFGLPFFYWFQTNWLVICSGFYLAFAYLEKKGEDRNAAASGCINSIDWI